MRRLAAIPVVALALGLFGAGSAAAQVVTVGSPLTGTFTSQGFSGSFTALNAILAEPGAQATAPVTGTIVRWRLRDPIGSYQLRVLTPNGGKAYTGSGTSAAAAPGGAGVQVIPTSLPIAAGQTIGVDTQAGDRLGGRSLGGSSLLLFTPPLADGATGTAVITENGIEAGFNADVATDVLGRAKRNRRRGTAALKVRLPGPGSVTLRGKGLRGDRAKRGGASAVRLAVKPKGRLRHKLSRAGSAKVRVRVSYVPTGVLPGAANVQHRTIKLRRSR
jgi:hypothetical protein